MSTRIPLLSLALLLVPIFSEEQPFFAPGVSSFTPQIATLNTGAKNDVQATVSPDRKYVTLNMQPQNAQLLNLFQFQFQGPPLGTGFVGGVQFANAANAAVVAIGTGIFGTVNTAVVLSPGKGAIILQQRGMTRIISP